MASVVAPVPSLFVPQSAPCPQGAGSALPMDWEDVSVKDEPPDVPSGLPGELTVMNDDFEDSKDTITVNSLGEVHYLPAGSTATFVPDEASHGACLCDVVTDGVTVKVEETPSDMDPLTIAPIKQEEEEAGTSGTVATSDLSYLDDPRWYMSPEDREIDPESSYEPSSEVITVEPRTLVAEFSDGAHSSSGLHAGAVNRGSVELVSDTTRGKGVSNTVRGKGVSNTMIGKGVSNTPRGKTARHSKKCMKVSVDKLLPCVVQLCQVHHCGVDCRCTVKAPYPAKLNAVTISTEQNVMSLNRSTGKGSHKKQQTKTAAQKPGSNMLMSAAPNMTSDRTGLGKRQAKLSNKLKLYMEERHKKATKKETSVKNIFVCPICDKGFSYIFSFKQHIITHDVTEILNMNLPPRSKTILPTGQAETGQAETGQAETGQAETVPEETGQAETSQGTTIADDSSASPPASYKTLRTLLSDEVSQSTVVDTACQQQVSALLSTGPSSPVSKNPISSSKKARSPIKKSSSPISTKSPSPRRTKIRSPPSKQTKSPGSNARPRSRTQSESPVDTKTENAFDKKKSESAVSKKSKNPFDKETESPACKTTESAVDKKSESAVNKKNESLSSKKTGVVLKVPKFKPASQQKKKKKTKASPPVVVMSGSLGLGEVVMYERGMKINEATFNVKDSTSPVAKQTSGPSEAQHPCVDNQPAAGEEEAEGIPGQSEAQPPCVDNQQAAGGDEPAKGAIREPSEQNIIVIAPINDFSPPPGADNFSPQPGADDQAASVSPKAKPNVGEKPVKRLKPRRAKPSLKVKLNIKQKLATIKTSPTGDESHPPPLIRRSPSRANSSSSPTLKIKTSPKSSPKSSPRAKPKVGALKGEKEDKSDNDSVATAPYGDEDEDDRNAEFSADDDDDYVPSKKGKSHRSASMMRWMKQFSVKRNQHNAKSRGSGGYQPLKKKESDKWGNKRWAEAVTAKSALATPTPSSSRSRRGQSRSLGGTSSHNNNNDNQGSDVDMDSGIDLESDGSEQKKLCKQAAERVLQKAASGSTERAVHKPAMSQTARVLQMLDGQLVSRQELWVCVQARLDGRKQKEGVLCPMCDKEFHYPSALKRHVMMHTDERAYQCPECPKAFSRKPHLTEHIRVHTGERPFKCAHCPAAFAQRTNLKIHNRTHTGARPFKCPECGKRFRRQDAHTQHILTHHSKVKPYKCSECSAAFPCARYLKDHLRVHSTERPFKCEMCPAAFVCKKYLLLHVRALHLNERPFTCKLCPAKFAQSGKLTEHNRVHTGERPYKCSSCGASFSRSGHLRRHLLTHTGVRPHQCLHCEASFSQQDHLKRHVKNIHRADM